MLKHTRTSSNSSSSSSRSPVPRLETNPTPAPTNIPTGEVDHGDLDTLPLPQVIAPYIDPDPVT